MGLTQLNFDGLNKPEAAIHLIREYEPEDGYYLAFSGGKDSVVIYDLVCKSGVKFDAHYNVSPIDPPEIYSFIKEHYPGVAWDVSARSFWKRFLTEGPPMRHMRWCCALIKEAGGIGRYKIVGTRRQESSMRKGYDYLDASWRHPHTYFVRPILEWSQKEVWEYITLNNLSYCSLYDEGFNRLGCVLCPFEAPMTTKLNLQRFPRIVANWRSAFARYYLKRIERGTPLSFNSSEEYWQWWISRKGLSGSRLTKINRKAGQR